MWSEGAHLAMAEAGVDTDTQAQVGDILLLHFEAAAKL